MHGVNVADRPLTPLGFEQVDVTGTAQKLPNLPKKASYAYIQAQGGDLRWNDFEVPTGVRGHLIPDGEDLWFIGDLDHFMFIKDDGEADHEISITYYMPE